jgi:hypothetical protein
MLRQLAVPVRHGFVQAYASSIQEVFVIAVPIALLAFVVVWLLPHVELRGAARGPATRLPTAEPAMSGDHAKTTAEINDDPSEAAISR